MEYGRSITEATSSTHVDPRESLHRGTVPKRLHNVPTTLDKPAGLPVFPPHADAQGDCVLARLLADQPWRGETAWPEGFEGGIAHRLDTSTSGALLVADNLEELARIRDCFREHRFVKTYLFLAGKDVPWDRNGCDKPLAHAKKKRGRMVAQRGHHTAHRGKWYPATTAFERIRGRLFRATMSSGVTHQVRVHAAFIGIPLAGDPVYGGGSLPSSVPPGVTFLLHHVGLRGPEGFITLPVPQPGWANAPKPTRS